MNMYINLIKKALKKANERGFDFPLEMFFEEIEKPGINESIIASAMLPLIYSHEFARAIWGLSDHVEIIEGKVQSATPAWKHQLCQMVLSEDPLLYLADHMNDYETVK
jgi:hypothetical protein